MNKNKLVFANWKMNLHSEDINTLVKGVLNGLNDISGVDIVLAPTFPYLGIVKLLTANSKIRLSAQNVFWEESGSYTGEVSPGMLLDVGCTWAMIGHSERRQHLLETNEMINKKVLSSTLKGLNIILCVGESFDQRRTKKTFASISDQLHRGLRGVGEEFLPQIVIGYEPIWVIGSGQAASLNDISSVHNFIFTEVESMFPTAESLPRIVYGGSVNTTNVEQIVDLDNVDGVLVGNASMDCDKFCDIVLKVVK
ncbi:triose-phosphate isomerase [bacterium]|jgi:triosephosphate isomerase|nr:triose-phosphate isomerase [bacterium]MBT3795728.1 triose-phosphate isomerase [bacterium]MBT4633928.1 triose-phosphate isomerase [bacterium]